jgi:DNA-binding LacI/PurR family transcriptional regulator
MKPFRTLSAVEQFTAYLREEIQSRRLDGAMPGVAQLVKQLGVGTKTVVAAIEVLKKEGVLEANGERKRSSIIRKAGKKAKGLRVRILLYESSDAHDEHMMQLSFRLEENGHRVRYANKTLMDLHFDEKRVARMVEKDDADAWIIRSGSRPVLEWFAAQPLPAFAMFGSQSDLPMASLCTVKSPALIQALQRLVSLGHNRIVMLTREDRRKPTPGFLESRYLEELTRLEIAVGDYHLPDWENDHLSFRRCLDSLFRFTPPTALFISEPSLFFAVQQYLLVKGLKVPRDVSLVAMEEHLFFEWFQPMVSHLRTETHGWVPRIVQWVNNVAHDRKDDRETRILAQFVEGGTIGRAM